MKRAFLALMCALCTCLPAWAGVTTCAPPSDEIALWEPAIRLANMEVAPASVAHVRLVIDGDRIRIVVRDSPLGAVEAKPRDEAGRENIAHMAASLAEPDPTPAAPPAAEEIYGPPLPDEVAAPTPPPRRRARRKARQRAPTPTPRPAPKVEPEPVPIEMPTAIHTGPNVVEVELARPSTVLYESTRFNPTGFKEVPNLKPRPRLDVTVGFGTVLRQQIRGPALRVGAETGITVAEVVRVMTMFGVEAPAPYVLEEDIIAGTAELTVQTWAMDMSGGMGWSPNLDVVTEPMVFVGATYRVFREGGSIWRPWAGGQLTVLTRPRPTGQFGVRTALRGDILTTKATTGTTSRPVPWSFFSAEIAVVIRFVGMVDPGRKKDRTRVIR